VCAIFGAVASKINYTVSSNAARMGAFEGFHPMTYDDVHSHHLMIEDYVRTGTYRAAIAEVVRPGARVMDFGCGSGILSIFAARAGASKVYAVDRSPFIGASREIARQNGADAIEFHRGEAADVDIPTLVDVLISEWMGHFLFYEWMLDPLVTLRDRFLAPGGIVLPATATPKVGLVRDERIRHVVDYFSKPRYGIDFGYVAGWALHHVAAVEMEESQVTTDVIGLGEIDLLSCAGTPSLLEGSVRIREPARIYGLCGWFDVRLTDTIGFGTGPFDPRTHWRQLLFPLAEPIDLRAGDRLSIEIRPIRDAEAPSTMWRWAVVHEGRRMEMDDFVNRAWLART